MSPLLPERAAYRAFHADQLEVSHDQTRVQKFRPCAHSLAYNGRQFDQDTKPPPTNKGLARGGYDDSAQLRGIVSEEFFDALTRDYILTVKT